MMKLTEEEFYSDSGDEITNTNGLGIRLDNSKIKSHEDLEKECYKIKQQILENQEKLEKIKEWLNDPEIKWVEDYDFEILRKILDEESK